MRAILGLLLVATAARAADPCVLVTLPQKAATQAPPPPEADRELEQLWDKL